MQQRLATRRSDAALGHASGCVDTGRAHSAGASERGSCSASRARSSRGTGAPGRAGSAVRSELRKALLGAAALLVAGCTTIPGGPSVMVLPGSTRSFDQFRADDGECRQYSAAQVAGKDGANEGATTQQRYDFAFQQCMYARGHQIPLPRGSMPRQPAGSTATSPPPPPPPAGTPPPPPAGYRVN